jgi:hypothetical protein
MKTLIVGGDINKRKSKIISMISKSLNAVEANGILPSSIKGFDLTIWMPNIGNDKEKVYPAKNKGSVLICSKVMREGYTRIDSVSRIFKTHANAVIEVYKEENRVRFQLVDALGNEWGKTTEDIDILCKNIMSLYKWTKGSIRKSLTQVSEINSIMYIHGFNINMLEDFMVINNRIAQKCAVSCGNRYFGNYSTRCTKLFPSMRNKGTCYFLFSPRNTDKRYVTSSDMVVVNDLNQFYGNKPSVDTPVQLEVYKTFKNINFMIHGHAYIKGEIKPLIDPSAVSNAPFTKNYYPCGDLRDVDEICKLVSKGHKVINLINHGFLILAEELEEFDKPMTFLPLNR